MILQKEIVAKAEAKRVAKSTIDKDWVLGHFLSAIYSEPDLKRELIFKGGTCLKKCYIADYRFSEDLDFTARHKEFELTEKHVQHITAHVESNSGVHTYVDSLLPLKFKDELMGYKAIIRFWGADHSQNEAPPTPDRWQTKIKLEIILYELMVFDEAHRKVMHDYSDKIALETNEIPCYSIEEVMAEKLRALIQRSYTAPRDFYDIWYLQKHYPELDFKNIVKAFHAKMKFKKLEFKGVEQLMDESDDKKLRASWQSSLAHQIQEEALPEFDRVKKELTDLFKKIF